MQVVAKIPAHSAERISDAHCVKLGLNREKVEVLRLSFKLPHIFAGAMAKRLAVVEPIQIRTSTSFSFVVWEDDSVNTSALTVILSF